jgi:hypothetical protein
MKDLREELRTAEARYYIGQLLSVFFLGIVVGSGVGWMIWS